MPKIQDQWKFVIPAALSHFSFSSPKKFLIPF